MKHPARRQSMVGTCHLHWAYRHKAAYCMDRHKSCQRNASVLTSHITILATYPSCFSADVGGGLFQLPHMYTEVKNCVYIMKVKSLLLCLAGYVSHGFVSAGIKRLCFQYVTVCVGLPQFTPRLQFGSGNQPHTGGKFLKPRQHLAFSCKQTVGRRIGGGVIISELCVSTGRLLRRTDPVSHHTEKQHDATSETPPTYPRDTTVPRSWSGLREGGSCGEAAAAFIY